MKLPPDEPLPNAAILLGCLLAGRGEYVDWQSIARAAVICEQPVPQPPPDEKAGEP